MGVTVSIGDSHLTLTVRISTNLFTFCRASRTQFIGHAFALRLHSTVNRFRDGVHIVNARDTNVDHIHTPRLDTTNLLKHLSFHISHQLLALQRKQILHGALVDLFLKRIAHHTAELVGTCGLVRTHVANVFRGLGNTPAHIPINHHTLLFCSQHGLVVRAVQRQQAFVDVSDILKRWRQFEVQPWLSDDFLDLPKRIQHTKLALVNDKQHRTG